MTAGTRPLVVSTRPAGADGPFRDRLSARGVDLWSFPVVAIEPPRDPARLDAALAQLDAFDWVLVTSPNGADALVSHPAWQAYRAAHGAAPPRVAAIGAVTAEWLARAGVTPTLTADGGVAELADALAATSHGLHGVRCLWPCSSIARPELAARLRAAGADLAAVVAYRTVPITPGATAEFTAALAAGQLAGVAFFSPSAVSSLAGAMGPSLLTTLSGRTLVASIGPTTSAALVLRGAQADVEAQPHTAANLADRLADRLIP